MFKINQKIKSAWLLMLSLQPAIIMAGAGQTLDQPNESVHVSNNDSVQTLLTHPVDGIKGRALSGSMGRSEETKANKNNESTEYDEMGQAHFDPVFQAGSIIDQALANKIAKLNGGLNNDQNATESIRLMVYLNYFPHEQVFKQTIQNHHAEITALEFKRQGLLAETAGQRDSAAPTDALNYPSMLVFDEAYKDELKAMNTEHEALSLLIKNEAVAEISDLINRFQHPIKSQLNAMGVDVEFGAIAGNVLVVKAKLDQVETIATIPGVLRIAEDVMMEGQLNVLPAAAMVDPDDSSLLGLWDSGADGGIYDPAIIDSGLDDNHPAMQNSASPLRNNFQTWYLVAANDSTAFDDANTTDDLQGHGTAVAGIVGSYGSSGFTSHLGMSHGVDKLVNLKAGFLNTSGTASMFYSDLYRIVDRGLNNTNSLMPSNSFNDDIDGMNLSYGGATSLDDTDVGRFLDAVIASYTDTPITVSAGNSGPTNTLFSDTASAYNVITVGNANDRNTVSRDDDIMRSSSTVGPTANGRKKPDISTYGSFISAPNNDWEGASADFVNFTGTSASAPVVLGVIMDLNDAGLFDELAVKALLINTAQKNLPSVSIEDDSDGWDPQVGWGVMNAFAAYFHRFDTFKDSVTPRNTDGDFQLYKGSMRDEGILGEGRDRATLVWNRSATYEPNTAPSEYFGLSDINLRLYAEDNNNLLDTDLNGIDNVHQVRVGAGATDTDVVVKVYAWSTTFVNGDAAEEYALATEDGFTRVDFPTQFQGIAVWPTEVEPNEVFDVQFWLRNDSDLASHNNEFDLNLPAGFTLISGVDTQVVGSAAAKGGNTSTVTYTIQAAAVVADGINLQVQHSHNSYLEDYGPFNWNMGINVRVDNTPPTPNPMGFASLPNNNGLNQLSMLAQTAFDTHNDPIQYYHDFTSAPSGGFGGTDSGWINDRNYTDLALDSNHEYCYRVWARDSAASLNVTAPSASACSYTSQPTPEAVLIGGVATNSITVSAAVLPPNIILGSSGLQFNNVEAGTTSAWQQNNTPWESNGLTAATEYTFTARARNGDGDVSVEGPAVMASTLANPPAVNSIELISDSQIQINLNANSNGLGAEYLIQNVSNGIDSGWRNQLSWVQSGLACNTSYTYQARARNPDGIETIIVSVGTINNDCSTDVIFVDGFDN
ncbi:S8 family serine peptidase [Marinicella litoralis]|uniref:Uncharacterized protein n=1 Tax=Marinicella litoralis TaxID=644220 RepID=A0A4R6XV05_9GAMM|nr:S8 family serine peptidase [Marinicella litoralis]TDR23842.1 hypothetical protein C8D91_0709 [Marinicella litoralis]